MTWGALSHAFVAVKLLLRPLGNWLAPGVYLPGAVEQAVGSLQVQSKPFLALRVRFSDDPFEDYRRVLFFVSARRPAELGGSSYFSLRPLSPTTPSSSGSTLVVHQALPFRADELFLHIYPGIDEHYGCCSDDGPSLPGQLDAAGMDLLRKAYVPEYRRRVALAAAEAAARRWSGGDDPVLDDWSTWGRSYTSGIGLRHALGYARPEEVDLYKCGILDDLGLANQFNKDYSFTWPRGPATISWIQQIRSTSNQEAVFATQSRSQHAISRDENWRSRASDLSVMPVPHNGETPRELLPEEIYEYDDEPLVEFPAGCPPGPAIPIKVVEVIAFDLFGTIFDRLAGIQEALQLLAGGSLSNIQVERLVCRYIECEALRGGTSTKESYEDVARGTIQDIAGLLGIQTSSTVLEQVLETLLRPRVFSEALTAVKELHSRGYMLVGIVPMDSDTFSRRGFQRYLPRELSLCIQAMQPARLWMQDASLLSEVLDIANQNGADSEAASTLLVTTSRYRMVEPALQAGFPTALIRREGDLEAHVVMPNGMDPAPSIIVTDLRDLCERLLAPPVPPTAETAEREGPVRVKEHYALGDILGSGSGMTGVVEVTHLLTGEACALKSELSYEIENELCLLPYEAQTYRVLEGVPGIPSLRWAGTYSNANVLILDKLGPTVDLLHKMCRRRFSLRTVLMLADQTLERLEAIHERGIIVHDVKPDNMAMGADPDSSGTVHLFDFGLGKLYVDPANGAHMPFREGLDYNARAGRHAELYASYNYHLGRELSRRDDLEALGNSLLFLLHGRLPWANIFAPSRTAKLVRIGEMKAGRPLVDLLARSPPVFAEYFDHVRMLAFEERPDYALLRSVLARCMKGEGWAYDARRFDWVDPRELSWGTLVPGEYSFDIEFVDKTDDVD